MSGWTGGPGWATVNGQLVNDGSGNNSLVPILAPLVLPTSDYAVEAEIVPGRWESCFCNRGLLLVARYDRSKGVYYFGPLDSASEMGIFHNAGGPPSTIETLDAETPAESPLFLRAELRGNNLRLFVDGQMVVETSDNRGLEPGRVGVACAENQGTVRSFVVTAL